MRYLVTGGAGFIGSHLADALTTRGDEVVVIDDLSTGRIENLERVIDSPEVRFVEGSVLDRELVDEQMKVVDACFHLAAAVGVQLVVADPLNALKRNVRGNDVVISSAAEHGRKVVFASTSEIYGKNSEAPLVEEADQVLGSPVVARWAYATSKAFGEALAHGYHRSAGTPIAIARIFSAVGPRQAGAYGMVLPRFVRQAIAGAPLTVYGNGTQSRCFVHVLDVVDALLLLVDSDAVDGRVFNVGSGTEVPIIELARRVIERTGSASTIELVPYEKAYGQGFEELWRRRPDTSALRRATGWSAERALESAIDDVIAFQRSPADRSRSLRIAG